MKSHPTPLHYATRPSFDDDAARCGRRRLIATAIAGYSAFHVLRFILEAAFILRHSNGGLGLDFDFDLASNLVQALAMGGVSSEGF